MNADKVKQSALDVLNTESRAILSLRDHIDDRFFKAYELMRSCRGHLVLTGIGKSGHIARKIAATLSSIGNPSLYMHPADANHGDLGVLREHDVLLALSYSGESDEINLLLPALKRLQIKLIVMTGALDSKLARAADACICVKVGREACPLGLAPTASTTAMLAMGDALAAALLTDSGFSDKDFAYTHPAGQLGRRLLLRLGDVMRCGEDIPVVCPDTPIIDALYEMSGKGLGMTLICENAKPLGIFTDGDLRRAVNNKTDLHTTPINKVMSRNFESLHIDDMAADALPLMENKKINSAPVLDDEGRLVGALNLHDLLRAGI